MIERPFSVLMDETTDVGTSKQAAMVVKFTEPDGSAKTAFYDMKVTIIIYNEIDKQNEKNVINKYNKIYNEIIITFSIKAHLSRPL